MRKLISGMRNLSNYKELVKPWIIDKNLLSPICYNSIIPNYILNVISEPTDNFSYHLLKKLLSMTN